MKTRFEFCRTVSNASLSASPELFRKNLLIWWRARRLTPGRMGGFSKSFCSVLGENLICPGDGGIMNHMV
ncbi:hypothetical protein N5C66_27430 [Rhizobium pusense]|uniref:hypothetical protein n=1 Tax=Rhizobium/Agrobacterium group TaxID=227290 RepID=UPI00142DF340|nr:MULTISPECIES: hypothetical protein [Rhizobium/Agrobacterium group]MDH1098965.1 hypothetical protein [Agrobacterium pusense]MDH1115433.1 hypothetical protein [Agrobacterium pusense]MDH2197411.1 hypothetical protein [Agrobacterium pusense]CAD7048550.1 hypothetical protein RP007_05217 [Rhizobium sp. P007]CAD7049030.1 hypothetical protein RP007_05276 [Rhizobium sp. P007]